MTATETALERLLATRRSCRAFARTPVDGELLERLFTLAQLTPSWCNVQPWQVTLTSGAATRRFSDALYAHATASPKTPDFAPPSSFEGVYATRRREAGFALYASLGIERSDGSARDLQMLENFRFFGAPHVAVVTTHGSLGTYGAVDCGAYVSNLLTIAHSLGIASVAQGAVAMHAEFVRSFLSLREERLVVCAVALGHLDPSHPANAFRTPRAPLAEVLHHITE